MPEKVTCYTNENKPATLLPKSAPYKGIKSVFFVCSESLLWPVYWGWGGVGVGVGIKESVVQLLQERSAVKGKSKNLVGSFSVPRGWLVPLLCGRSRFQQMSCQIRASRCKGRLPSSIVLICKPPADGMAHIKDVYHYTWT